MKRYLSQYAALASGRVVAALTAIVSIPIITRLFAADTYGEVASFISIASLLTPIFTLTIDRAIPVASSTKDLKKRLSDCVEISTSITLHSLPFFLVVCTIIILSGGGIVAVAWIVSILEALALIFISANLAEQRSRRNATADVAMSLTLNLSRIVCGLLGKATISALLVSYIFSLVMKTFILARVPGRGGKINVLKVNELIKSINRYREFPRYALPSQFLTTASSSLPVIVLSSQDMALAGCYAIAQRIIKYPVEFFVGPVRGLNVRALSEATSDKLQLLRVLKNLLIYHAAIAVFFSFGLFFAAGWFVSRFLGEQYGAVQEVLIWLIPLLFINITSAPVYALCTATGRQKKWLSNEAVSAMIRTLVVIILFTLDMESQVIISAFSFVTLLVKIPLLILIYIDVRRAAKRKD